MAARKLNFEQSPVPGVDVEFIYYVLTLPEEVRNWLGNFLLDSTVEGFDGDSESSARLWTEELERRCQEAEDHPEKLLTMEEVMESMKARLEQLRLTPCPNNLHGYHCRDYFGDGWAERGHFDDHSHCWIVKPLLELHPEQRLGFFAIGEPGVDGIRFGYRYGERGLWAYYPIGQEFRFVAATIEELIEGWQTGTITV